MDLKDSKAVEKEVEYAITYIRKAPSNPSSWNYLRGLLEPFGMGPSSPFPQVTALCEELGGSSGSGDAGGGSERCVLVRSWRTLGVCAV